jgi:hypothetical protein
LPDQGFGVDALDHSIRWLIFSATPDLHSLILKSRFAFKPLAKRRSIKEYFGDNGLGMFVAGIYAAGESSAGMVGYVQTENSPAWLGRLARGFARRSSQLRVCETFRSAQDYQDIGAVRMSGHDRTTLGRIDIYHLLLEFV